VFTHDRNQMRAVFFRAWKRNRNGFPLEGIEQLIVAVAQRHPEYHAILDNAEDHGDRDYLPDLGQTNPFLHMSMHIAIAEQLSIDQPRGVRAHYQAILAHTGADHDAEHRMMECLGELLWQAGRAGSAPDQAVYLDCLARLSGIGGQTR